MKTKALFAILIILSMLITSIGLADDVEDPSLEDGVMFRRNVSHTPTEETERANINHMAFYVPAQTSSGESLLGVGVDYYLADGQLADNREYAKPLVSVYIDALPEEAELGSGGAGIGAHDAHAALSLDDGATWKRTNLSNSAHLSSFTLADGTVFPGDAHNMTFAIAGDKVLVGWISKYCDGGSPAYTWLDADNDALYPDIWGVAGSQGSVNYTLQGYPNVGEIPYSCVWSARGQLLLDDETGLYDIVWTKAERLTSGRRDANRLEMNGDSAAGFMMVWQEDPEGLRPGQGLGPGEGWSGAVVNQQTDLWYSYISIDDFDMVDADADYTTAEDAVALSDFDGDTTPKVAVPMALPVRLTDNKMCKADTDTDPLNGPSDPYCYMDFDGSGTADLCADTVSWTNPGGTGLNLCVAEDGRVMAGRVGASRPRVNVQPYDADGDGTYDAAWVIMGAEESKALGEGSTDDDVEPEDLGKNMWYYTFDLSNPALVQQGGMLNWPAKDPLTGELYEMLTDDWENEFYETEISRRFSHFSQPIHQVGDSGVSAVLIVKQGIINQGGPADIFLRMTQVPEEDWIECPAGSTYEKCLPAGYNPYAYENMVCENWEFTDGSNPRYVEGLCLDTGVNVSGGTIVSCDNGTGGEACAATFPWDGATQDFPKVTQWEQTVDNLDDESWENPFDVAKGHRGFIDGDFIMMMYAWSPNWKANSVGNDHYNLYARRSFDGGLTWTTTPAAWGGDGTTTCENYGAGADYTTVCTPYGAGEFEQARNLSQLTGNKETILDPRYTPTGGIKMLPITDLKDIGFAGYEDDVRDPSKFFIVYETGDNTTVAEGEAVPLDLFYSRATNWGDDYALVDYANQNTGDVTSGFDWLEHDLDDLSGEAANTANGGGTVYYAIWNQWKEDEHENVSDSDAMFRRLYWLPDDSTIEMAPTARILYVSTDMLDLSTAVEPEDFPLFVGTGWDRDSVGDRDDVRARWWCETTGHEYFERTFQSPPNGWIPGKHDFKFQVEDTEGQQSNIQTVTIWVAEKFYNIYLPTVTR